MATTLNNLKEIKLRTRKISLTLIVIFLFASLSIETGNAAVKAGTSCSKLNQTSGSGLSKFTCKKVSGKLKWVATPSAPTLGSISNPVPMGTSLTISKFTYVINALEFGMEEEICASSAFNDGCTFDDNLDPIVDPDADFYWAAVNITALNRSAGIAKPAGFDTTFYLVLPNGQLLRSDFFTMASNNFGDVQVIPGGKGTGYIFFKIPNENTSLKTLIVIRDSTSFLAVKDYFFTVN